MKRSLLVLIAGAAVLAAALVGFGLMRSGGDSPAYAQPVLTVSLDMDTTDGPCTDIDPSGSHLLGSNYDIAICVENLFIGNPIGVLAFDVIYDDQKNLAPEVADAGQGLDDNPH